MKVRMSKKTAVLVLVLVSLVCAGWAWAGAVQTPKPMTLQEKLSRTAGVQYISALEAARRGQRAKARKTLGHLFLLTDGTPAGYSIQRRLASLDRNAKHHFALSLTTELGHSVGGKNTRKRRKMELLISADSPFVREIKMKAAGGMLYVKVEVTPGKGVKAHGWIATMRKVRRFQWPWLALKAGSKQKQVARLTLDALSGMVSLQVSSVTSNSTKSMPKGKLSVTSTKSGTKVVRRSNFRMVFRKASVKQILDRLAEMQGLTPRWSSEVDLTRKLALTIGASSRAALLQKACRRLRLDCQIAAKMLTITNAKRPLVPAVPRVPAVPKGTPSVPAAPRVPTPPAHR